MSEVTNLGLKVQETIRKQFGAVWMKVSKLKHLMKLTICCEEFSAQILNSIHDVVCSDKVKSNYRDMCWILTITNRDETKRLLYKIIEKSNICQYRCPLNQKSNFKRNHGGKGKRQFDLASTFDTIGQFLCGDVLNRSTQDGLHFLFKELGKKDNPVGHEYLRYMLLVRRPVCCLLQSKLRG